MGQAPRAALIPGTTQTPGVTTDAGYGVGDRRSASAGPRPTTRSNRPVVEPVIEPPEISDAAWARIAVFMPPSGQRARPWREHRQVIEGIVYRYRTGASWRNVPARFGPWKTVWKRHRRYTADGTWAAILDVLREASDAEGMDTWQIPPDASPDR